MNPNARLAPLTRVVIFDADGVLITPTKLFAAQYAEEHGYDQASFQEFFLGDFKQAIEGKVDLKELIIKHRAIWHWEADPQILLDQWFATENVIDHELLGVIASVQDSGLPVFMATNQERYRAQYLREVMFPDVFQEIFVSSEIGCEKKNPRYWDYVLADLRRRWPELQPEQVLFFDDSPDSLHGAIQAGINAQLYQGVEHVKSTLNL